MNRQTLFSMAAAVLMGALTLLAVLVVVYYAVNWYCGLSGDMKATTDMILKSSNLLVLLVIVPLQLGRRAKQKQAGKMHGEGDLHQHQRS